MNTTDKLVEAKRLAEQIERLLSPLITATPTGPLRDTFLVGANLHARSTASMLRAAIIKLSEGK